MSTFLQKRFIDRYHCYDFTKNKSKHLYFEQGFEMHEFEISIENIENLYGDYLDCLGIDCVMKEEETETEDDEPWNSETGEEDKCDQSTSEDE